MLVLSARGFSSGEIPLDRAEQSSTWSTYFAAANATDGDLTTGSATSREDPAWLRVYFKSSSNVEQVVIEKGFSFNASCVYNVSVYDGGVETECGAYTGKAGYYYNEMVQCGGKGGDSVRLGQTGCERYLLVYEIKVYGESNVTKCSKPTITNASLVPDSATIASGASYTVTCNEGFTMKKEGSVVSGGSNDLLCLANGSFSAPLPTCEAVTCSKPDITNAVLAPTSATIASGASYTVTCKAGFTLKKEGSVVSGGSNDLLCLANGSFSAPLPTCEAVTCSKPDITNAVLAPTSDTIASGASYTVTCNEGTVMSGGSAQLLCTDEGSFSASLPSCEATGDLISLDRAEQSSTYNSNNIAAKAIDGDLTTRSATSPESNPWFRVYFQNSSNLGKVVIEKGGSQSHAASCVYTVSVYDRKAETVCGTYTGKVSIYYNEMVQCGGNRGDSVRLKRTGCTITTQLHVYEIKVYGQGKYYNFTLLA